MALEIADLVQAAALVDGTAVVPAYQTQQGFSPAAISRPAAVGSYRLTLGTGLGLLSAIAQVNASAASPGPATPLIASWSRFDANTIDVQLADAAGAPHDAPFSIAVYRIGQ